MVEVLNQKAPRWRRRKEARPAELVAAALELFVERGFATTRLSDVARRAGVSKGTLYLYFDNKEALFEAAVRQSIVPHLEHAEQLVNEYDGPTPPLLRQVVEGWWSVMSTSPVGGIPKLIIAEAGNFPAAAKSYYDEVVLRVRRLFARVLNRGIERGEFRPMDVPYAVRALIAPMLFAAIWTHSLVRCESEPFEPQRLIGLHVDLFLNGISNPHTE